MSKRSLTGANAVVTGGGGGLGRALCLEVARRGGKVIVSDLLAPNAEETAALVREAGGEAQVFACDVAKPDEVDELANFAHSTWGEVDLLCNNAGVSVAGPFEALSLEDWRWIMDINLWGVIYGCRAFLPKMRERGRGHVLNVASAAGLLRTANMSPYNATKIAVVGLSETLHAEYRPHGVKVMALCPTFFKTDIINNGRGPEMPEVKIAEKRMKHSKIQAPDVARIALLDLEAGRIYSVPMLDGRALWRLKRLAPEAFYRVLDFAARAMKFG